MKIDLRQLRHVLAIDRHRNFARAAESVSLTQPALTRSLQSLERDLGARLFDRDRSGVVPTPIGVRFIERARLLLNQARDLEQDLDQMLGLEVGLLRVGAGPYPAELSVGTAVGRLVKAHPRLLVDLAVADWTELTRRVTTGDLELAVADGTLALDDERLSFEPLPRHQIFLFCRAGHPLAGRESLTVDEVRSFPLVGTSLPPYLGELAARDKRGLRSTLPEGTTASEIRVDTFALVLPVVLQSDAIGGAAPSQIRGPLERGEVVLFPLELPWLQTKYGIIRLADRTPSPAATAFTAILRRVESEID